MITGFPPILLQMARDRRLRPTDIQVYIVAAQYLDYVEYRPLKLFTVAHEMRMHASGVSRSLHQLVRLGYLARGARETIGGAWTFRLVFSLRVAESATTQPKEPSQGSV